jgi:hypothetical protein
MSLSFSFLKIIYDHPKKNDTINQKGSKGATKIYKFLFWLAPEHEQDLNIKPGPYPERYRARNLKVHFKINI